MRRRRSRRKKRKTGRGARSEKFTPAGKRRAQRWEHRKVGQGEKGPPPQRRRHRREIRTLVREGVF